jgi:hypothetical protein
LSTFVRPRATVVDRASGPEVFWMPYDATLAKAGEILADLQVGRYGGVFRLPFALRERAKTLRAAFRIK